MSFANTARRLIISGTDFRYFSEGAYALAFTDSDRRKVWKVYRADRDISYAHAREVFGAETKAYERGRLIGALAPLLPSYDGPVRVPGVMDRLERDVSSELFLDLAFQIEYVKEPLIKFEKLPAALAASTEALFRGHGIGYTRDASFSVINGKVHKVIDFATHYVEPFI